jgi:hypothetical protein
MLFTPFSKPVPAIDDESSLFERGCANAGCTPPADQHGELVH